MNRTSAPPRALLVVAVALLAVPGVVGCGAASHPDEAAWTFQPGDAAPDRAGGAATPGGGSMSEAMQAAAWAARPAYVGTSARTEEAYAFAMARPDVLQWMPCYCGCGAMGHRSNLDCFFRPARDGLDQLEFEEHASYCQICIDEALMAKQLLGRGESLRAIRDAIDQSFGGAAPGTQTDLPPA